MTGWLGSTGFVARRSVQNRVAAARERLAAANADNYRLYEALVPIVGSHCPGLARALPRPSLRCAAGVIADPSSP